MNDLLTALQERADYLKGSHPELLICKMCENKVDITLMGPDTTCPYHRMLWDYFMYPRAEEMELEEIRKQYQEWIKTTPKEELDKYAIEMASDPLNWEC